MKPFTIQDVIESTGARLAGGDARRAARGVSTDTRTLREGDLFVAIPGPNFDGGRFAAAAVERGAAGVLLEERGGALPPGIRELPRDTPILHHPSPRAALSGIASFQRARLSAPVVGVTGSCGKTTTKNILVELLSTRLPAVGSPDSFNNDIGVPHTLFLADDESRVVVVEMGTNHPGEIESLCRTARPTAGIVTCVGASHLEGLGSVEGVANEKAELVRSLPSEGFCVLNADCRWTSAMRRLTRAEVITFSLEGEGRLNATDVWTHAGGTTFRLEGREVTSPLLGLHNVQNLLAALAACRGLGLALDDVLPAVSRLCAGRRRLERIQAGRITILDDSYNANPESARASVRVLAGLHGHARRILVLGDMLELGSVARAEHERIGREAAAAGIDVLATVGELAQAAAEGAIAGGLAEGQVLHFADTAAAIAHLPALVRPGDVVLLKGSHRTGLDRLVERLVGVAREEAH
jgi:UDP-N-acetylmuramoyl-tripeptide--D-alanyl-D-alanine ligase